MKLYQERREEDERRRRERTIRTGRKAALERRTAALWSYAGRD